jgi:hypothetical protein
MAPHTTVHVSPVGVQGPPGPPGTPGGGEGGSYLHNQATPSEVWTIPHNLGFYPNVTVEDSAGTIVVGEVSYDSPDQLTLTFASAFAGRAFVS